MMRDCWVSVVLFIGLPTVTMGQVGFYLGGSATFPVGTYKIQGAGTGWMAHGRLILPLQKGLSLTAGASLGANPRDTSQNELESAEFTTLVAGLLYRLGQPDKPGLFVFWEAGRLKGGSYSDDKAITFTGGVGVAVPVSRPVEFTLSGSYQGVVLDSHVAFWSITAGLRFRLEGS